MPLPKTKLLPRVVYEPAGDTGAGSKGQAPQPTYNPMNYYNPMQRIQPPAQEVSPGQFAVPYTPPTVPSYNDPNVSSGGSFGAPNAAQPQSKPGTGEVMGPPSPTQQDWNAVAAKNQSNLAAAQASGDTANIARLQAEWERLKPFASQFNLDPHRLVTVYMDPKNPAAKNNLADAAVSAAMDDAWANAARQAGLFTGDPNRDNLLWQEHWQAMNVGGRDPLEGHPQAVQQIQAAAQQIQNFNQQGNYNDYQQWSAGI